MSIGKWAVIDIETSGADPQVDSVIDVGYLLFNNLELVESYQSLVRFPVSQMAQQSLSQFIEKLTGIKTAMLKNAPRWEELSLKLQEIEDTKLIAHNSSFEESFLESTLNHSKDCNNQWVDSLYFLCLLNPSGSSFKLENFITKWKLRDKEVHRGLEDSIDLLKVLILELYHLSEDKEFYHHLKLQFAKYGWKKHWFNWFLNLNHQQLIELAYNFDFDLVTQYKKAHQEICQEVHQETDKETDKKNHKENHKEKEHDPRHSIKSEFSFKNVVKIFESTKEIKKSYKNYEVRPSQIELAQRVGQAFKNSVHSLIQAPTGTGKTLGYLIPASLFVLDFKQSQKQQEKNQDLKNDINNQAKNDLKSEALIKELSNSEGIHKQVLVATGTKALQNQALEKDVPQLKAFLGKSGDDLKVQKLIGSSNHFCELLYRREAHEAELFEQLDDDGQIFTKIFYETVFFYNKLNPLSPITRESLPYVFVRKVKEFQEKQEAIKVDYRSCSGKLCPHKNSCSYVQALWSAKDADIIIGNHSLMFSWTRSFPRPSYIIVDEAHRLEKEATDAFTLELKYQDLKSCYQSLEGLTGLNSLFYLISQYESQLKDGSDLISNLRVKSLECAKELKEAVSFLDMAIESFFKKLPRYSEFFWNEVKMFDPNNEQTSIGQSIIAQLEKVLEVVNIMTEALKPIHDFFSTLGQLSEEEIGAFTKFETFFSSLLDIEQSAKFILDYDSKYAHSLKYKLSHNFSFCCSPINIGEIIKQELLDSTESVVMTSATLGGSKQEQGTKGVEWSTGYLYLEPQKRFRRPLFLPPVYDYESKAKVYLCDDTPKLNDPNFIPEVLEEIIPVLKQLGGKSLLLFGSKKRFELAREYLLEKLKDSIALFIQGMGANIVDDFRSCSEGVLLGMESFGEGIDVPGDALKFVFIDKIPDVRMDHVIKQRRDFYQKSFGNEFTDYYLSHRARSLHQKIGRLIRTQDDFGAVIIVDSRFRTWKADTSNKFLALMQPYQVVQTNLSQAKQEVIDLFDSK